MSAAQCARLQRLFASHGGGPVAFRDFMAAALYDPDHGYYMRRAMVGGRTGDFSTSATLDPLPGRAIAAWIKSIRPREPGRLRLIEAGAGSGALAAAILDGLGWWGRRRVDFTIVELSPALREIQHRVLAGRRVGWQESIEAALAGAQPGEDVVLFSNELVDAFPCDVFEWSGGAWKQLFLAPGEGGLIREVLLDPRPDGIAALDLSSAPRFFRSSPPVKGQRIEVHATFREWLARATALHPRMRTLTIDYGDTVDRVYLRRLRGTVRAYCRQMRFDGPDVYARFTHQDLTADINFTDLTDWARDLGLRPAPLATQGEFFQRWAPRDCRQAAAGSAAARLLDPDGPGGVFKVLETATALQAVF